VLLTGDTDWEEIHELVTESYRVLAPPAARQHLTAGTVILLARAACG
jgi:hypothetical protein